ncbi:MAG: magnesium transporter [Pseudomonadota bacterium]
MTDQTVLEDVADGDDAPTAEALYGLRPALVRAVVAAVKEGDGKKVRRLIHPLHFTDVADLLERLKPEDRLHVIAYTRRTLPPETLTELDEAIREEVLDQLNPENIAAAFRELETDDAIELVEDLDDAAQREILDAVDDEDRALIEEGLSYPEDSAGRLMQRHFASVHQMWTVGETIDFMRESEDLPVEFYELFVTDDEQRVVGDVPLNLLLRTRRPVRIRQIMVEDITTIPVTMDQEEVAILFRNRDLVSAPVVDQDDRIVGMITVDDVVDVIDEEAEEDLLRLSGVAEDDLYQATLSTTKSRFGWLAINLGTAIAASIVIGFFADTLQQIVALAILMPIVASMGGNAGTQTLTVAVRAIAMRELATGTLWRFIAKEVIVGAINGLLFAVLIGAIGGFWFDDPIIGVVIGLAMVINLVVAGFSGAVIPLLLDRQGIDPAVASSVILTTVTDIVGFMVFLGLATIIIL